MIDDVDDLDEMMTLADVSDEYREQLADAAADIGMVRFGAAVLDERKTPEALLEHAVRDVMRLAKLSEDNARLAITCGIVVGSAMRMVEAVAEAAMAPDCGDGN